MIGLKNKGAKADGQQPAAPARAPKGPPKKRRKGLGRLLAPAIQAAVGAMAFVFLFAAVVPAAWLNALAWQLFLDQISPLTTPPLGMGARIGFAVILALIAGLITFMIMLALVKPPAEGRSVMTRRVAERARKLATADEGIPAVRAADAHPDAPPRAPFRADRDLAAGDGDASQRKAAWMDELATESDGTPADNGAGDTLELGALDQVTAAEPAGDSLGALVARFEAGLARRRMIAATAANMVPPADTPAASNDQTEDALELGADQWLDGDEPTVDLSLEAALSTLQRMSRRAIG
ncbi:MAG: hypothetical protein RLZZ58_693 [Pseudomonadota bacterium]